MRRRIALLLAGIPLVLTLGWAVAGSALAGGGCHGAPESEARPSEAAANVVKIDGCTFAPTVARVSPGAEVRFINASQAFHDIVGRDHAWGTQGLDVGREFRHRFVDAGVYPFSCSLHPGMAGVIVVGAAPATAEADTADLQQAAAIEPADASTASDSSGVTALAAGAIGLVGGLALGAIGMRIAGRRDEAA